MHYSNGDSWDRITLIHQWHWGLSVNDLISTASLNDYCVYRMAPLFRW